ncbi:MAG: restriction endonuclease subunit R [Chloroflexi bacterium HGW-Chloroflexi-3]|nr:MAG: restriction endonuclease subunit R [Chloroflexi bacterium HGW-Chloroflexi-3]
MSPIGEMEVKTQKRVIKLFQEKLNYEYLGDWKDRPENSNIEEKLLTHSLFRAGYKDDSITKAIFELKRVAEDQSKSLYDINKVMYSLLRYGVKVSSGTGKSKKTVWLIDWKHPEKNRFSIAEEVTIKGIHIKRPDLVLYVNGIALGVIELKRSIVSISEGIRQNLDNQKEIFIRNFFATIQLVMAGNETEGMRYGVIETPEKHYLSWKEPSDVENVLERQLLQVCEKTRFLEIIHDFIVFDAGIKKICRHNQYFGVKAAQESLRRREGGIIWHTQGSGKSLTMVWLSKWIRENIKDSRVLIITDRTELDKQIEKVYKGVDENLVRSRSGRNLLEMLNDTYPPLICSLIHKFANRDEVDVEGYIEDIQKVMPKDFKAKGDIFVYVDECHRTQSGELHKAMKQILPDAIFIGFTGTPLLRADKLRSIEVFGKYIHTYKFDEAVRDQVILDLRYEARDIDQSITSQEKIDQWFEIKTKGLTDIAKGQLKQRWGTMQAVLSSRERLEKIVADILLDMETKDRLASGHGNALLVSGSIYQACRYYEMFTSAGFEKCAIVTSYVPNIQSIRGEETGDGETEKQEQYEIYQKMLNGKSVEEFESEAKKKFIEEPGQMKLLIVVDKLLTGFDAPPATYLFIDKKMQDHGLFQAICRVNRLDGDDKEYGYIVDYKDLFQSLEGAVKDYTSGALDGYEKADVEGLLSDRLDKAKDRLDETRESIKALCEPVNPPKDTQAYIHYFCGNDTSNKELLKETEPRRIALYKQTVSLIRAFANLANEMEEAGYSKSEIEKIKGEVDYYEKVRTEIRLASGDYIDLKMYEPAMRHLIDAYIRAEESKKISAFDDLSLIQLIVERGEEAIDSLPDGIKKKKEAVAETIENNLRRKIIEEQPVNPKYYENMSILLNELIRQRRAEALAYEIYLKKIIELTKQIQNPAESHTYPRSVDSDTKRALYDNLDQNEALANQLDYVIRSTKKDGWKGNKIKEREVRYAIADLVSEDKLDEIFELVKNQTGY